MDIYLSFASIVIALVWLYTLYNGIKSLKKFIKEAETAPFSPLEAFSFFLSASKSEKEIYAYKKLKQTHKKNFKLWVLTLFLVLVGAFIVGISTAIIK